MLESKSLRVELHEALDAVLDRFLGDGSDALKSGTSGSVGEVAELKIRHTRTLAEPYVHPWPDKTRETYRTGDWYEVVAPEGSLEMLVAETSRFAWHKERNRVVVFARWMGSKGQPYPWLEYCENDADGYSADLRNPAKPRSVLRDGEPLPNELTNAEVRRLDELYEGVRNGPSLRIVVERDDVESLIRYAYWTSRVVGRI